MYVGPFGTQHVDQAALDRQHDRRPLGIVRFQVGRLLEQRVTAFGCPIQNDVGCFARRNDSFHDGEARALARSFSGVERQRRIAVIA